jgi:ABC-type transport system involved in multi-copper enzyme maturation permease subunit
MNPVPIIHRELMILSRRRWFYWLRMGVGAGMALVSCIVIAVTWNITPQQNLGAPLFSAATAICFLVCFLSGPVLLSDCIAEEKSSGTLGLLFLTNSTSIDIVGGKFTALAMPAAHCLLAAVPVMGLSFVLGGVTEGEFLRTALGLINALFFSLATTLLCSVVARSGRTAFGASLLITHACCVALPVLVVLIPNAAWSQSLLIKIGASPALTLWQARDSAFAANSSAFTSALTASQIMSWLFLGLATIGLKQYWRLDPRAPVRTAQPREQSRLHKSDDQLDQLARHRLGGSSVAWAFAGGAFLGILLTTQLAHRGVISGVEVVLTAYALHGVFKMWVGWVASRAFAAERDCGALELLLITPLGEAAIWRTWLRGLRRRFLIPAMTLVGFDLLTAWIWSTKSPSGDLETGIYMLTILGGIVFLVDCYALSWIGLWSGLVALNATRACIRTLLAALILPGAAFANVLIALAIIGSLNLRTLMVLVPVWFIISFLLDVFLASFAMLRLSHDCREAAVSARR